MSALPGRPIEVAGNRPLRLDGEDAAFLVESGSVDVFAVAAAKGELLGARRRLFRVETGAACFGTAGGDGGPALLAVGGLGTKVRRVPLSELRDALAQGRLSPEAEDARRLAEGYARRVAAAVSEPKVKLFENVYVADRPLDSVAEFQGLLAKWIAERSAADETRERERLTRKAALNGTMFRGALAELASVIEAEGAAESAARVDDLLGAVRLVGAAMGAEIRDTEEDVRGLDVKFRVDAVCRASRLRHRRVALRGEWWTRDCGPLLALSAEGKPLAILPGRSGFEIADPADGSRRRAGPDSAARLDPFAWQLYKPFPDRPLRFTDLLSFVGRDLLRDAAVAAAMALAGAALGVVPALVTGKLFESAIPNADHGALFGLVAALIAAAVSAAVFALTQAVATLRLEGKWDAGVQAAMWDRLLRLPAPFFRDYAVGDLSSRAMAINHIRQAFSGATMASLVGGFQGLMNLGLLFWFDSGLAATALAVTAAAVAFYSFCLWRSLRLRAPISELEGKLSGLVYQLLGGISKMRVASAEARGFAVWSRLYAAADRLNFQAGLAQVSIKVFNSMLPVASSLIIYYVASGKLHPAAGAGGKAMSLGDFTAFTAAFTAFLSSSIQLSTTAFTLLDVIPVWKRAKPILETMPEVESGRPHPGKLTGRIDVHRVNFRYRKDGPKILDDVSFSVNPGEFVALVGPSGSGKSTVLRLLLGFEKPETGAVYYDGQDMAKLDVSAVRRQIGVVLQNGRLLAGDIMTNIIGNLPLTVDDAWAAAEAAGVAEDIRAMPMGMQTVISEGGSTLSGGQRQRLIIARALVRRPSNIYFDEATSALDNRTQAIVTESLDKMKATRVVIAHRLSTIINADRIVVMKDGKVVDQGRYEELMSRPGLFRDLASRQIA